jgi:fatty acid desaturase
MDQRSQVEAPIEINPIGDFVGNIPVKLTKEELTELSRINPWLSWLHIGAEWGAIVVTIYLCERYWSPILYLLAIAIIGARQHALLILMHDGVHYRLFRNRGLNDCVSEVVLGWPHLVAARSYRKNHIAHHRYLNSEKDPDWKRRQNDPAWVFPKPADDLARLLFRDVSGLNAIVLLRLAASLLSADTVSTGFLVTRYGFYAACLALIVYAGALKGFALYWIIPLFTWLVMIMRVRSIAEHSAIENGDTVYAQTRTTRAAWLERIFLAPKNVNYHLEHHFFPSVPFHRLPKLHALLLSKPGFREGAHLSDSYWGVLRESVGGGSRPATYARRWSKTGAHTKSSQSGKGYAAPEFEWPLFR